MSHWTSSSLAESWRVQRIILLGIVLALLNITAASRCEPENEPKSHEKPSRLDSIYEETSRILLPSELMDLPELQQENGKTTERSIAHQSFDQQSSESELANQVALEEQVRSQRDLIEAQAASDAEAIREQQSALARQHELLSRRQFREAIRDSPEDLRWRLSSEELRGSPSNVFDTIQFSDELEWPIGRSKGEDDKFEIDASKLDTSFDLSPAAQHHSYGAHYGSLHKHQGKYYQYAESHKKGQYKAGFKRGNKKFHISGQSMQHKSHAKGHVKWHGKKGKGSHHWDLKHKDKKHHHHYH